MKNLKRIISSAQDGVLDAHRMYSKMSNGKGIEFSGVEHFVCVKIAESIHSRLGANNIFVTLEHPVQRIIQEAEQRYRGRRPAEMREYGRVDLVVWDQDENPRVIIEIKRNLRWANLQNDAKRIEILMKKYGSSEGGTLEAGCLLVPFVTWRAPNERTVNDHRERILEIEEEARNLGFRKNKEVYEIIADDDPFREIFEDRTVSRINHKYGCMCLSLFSSDS